MQPRYPFQGRKRPFYYDRYKGSPLTEILNGGVATSLGNLQHTLYEMANLSPRGSSKQPREGFSFRVSLRGLSLLAETGK